MAGISRRGLLGAGITTVAASGAAFAAGRALADDEDGVGGGAGGAGVGGGAGGGAEAAPESYPFFGTHQAGIVTPAQDRLHFAAFDVTTASRAELIALLKAWTEAASRMTQGRGAGEIGPTQGSYNAPPDDTGEAIGLPPARLTLTFGFGPSLFRDAAGKDRFGIAAKQPAELRTLPHFPADNLDAAASGGDLCVQACADDPQIAVHAVRNLARIAMGTATVRYSQLGFGRTSSTSTSQETPRNLFGYKDGTSNLKAEDGAALDQHLWVGASDGQAWLAGGSYLVARRIRMRLEVWDRQSLRDQDAFVGRTKDVGAPLSGGGEFTVPDFAMQGRSGPIIPPTSHLAVVHPDNNDDAHMLRRGYNFVDGSDTLGGLNAGLFFIAYVRKPSTQFIPVQNAMAKNDALMEYLQFTSSSLFAVPPGVTEGQYLGQSLFT